MSLRVLAYLVQVGQVQGHDARGEAPSHAQAAALPLLHQQRGHCAVQLGHQRACLQLRQQLEDWLMRCREAQAGLFKTLVCRSAQPPASTPAAHAPAFGQCHQVLRHPPGSEVPTRTRRLVQVLLCTQQCSSD